MVVGWLGVWGGEQRGSSLFLFYFHRKVMEAVRAMQVRGRSVSKGVGRGGSDGEGERMGGGVGGSAALHCAAM